MEIFCNIILLPVLINLTHPYRIKDFLKNILPTPDFWTIVRIYNLFWYWQIYNCRQLFWDQLQIVFTCSTHGVFTLSCISVCSTAHSHATNSFQALKSWAIPAAHLTCTSHLAVNHNCYDATQHCDKSTTDRRPANWVGEFGAKHCLPWVTTENWGSSRKREREEKQEQKKLNRANWREKEKWCQRQTDGVKLIRSHGEDSRPDMWNEVWAAQCLKTNLYMTGRGPPPPP